MRRIVVFIIAAVLVVALAGASGSGPALAAATTKSLSTNFTIMNLSQTATANIHVAYMKQYNGTTAGGTWPADSSRTDFTIAPAASKVVAQYFDTTLTNGAGSVTISSSEPIAAISNILARSQTPTSGSYTGFGQGAQSFFMPFAFKNKASSVGTINSQLIVMNLGAAPTTVTVQLIWATTGLISHTKTINNLPAGESFYYDQNLEAALPNDWQGSAKITAAAGGTIAAVGNQFTGADGLLTYPGFAAGYTQWVVPVFFSRLNNGYNSIVVVQNVSGSTLPAGSITFSSPILGSSLTNPAPVPANASWIINPRQNASFPTQQQGPAKINSPSGNVVVIVNQLKNETPATTSPSALSFNAIPTNLTGKKVVAPLIMSRLTSNGYSTVFTVANLTSTAGTCDFLYKTDGSIAGNTDVSVNAVPLPADGSILHNHRLPSSSTNNHGLPANWQGSVTVSCTQPVGGFVNQIQAGAAGDPDLSYNAFTID